MSVATPNIPARHGGRRLVVAGGGTGGHLFPGIAVAQSFKARHRHNRILFINAGRPLDVQILSQGGWDHRSIAIEGMKGRSGWRQFMAAIKIPKAIWVTIGLLKTFQPDVVLGVGGYSAGPVVVAAWWLGMATALHEQNQLPGITNRILGRIVNRIFLSFEDENSRFNPRKVLVTGNPVRDEILILGNQTPGAEASDGFSVLVVGGSQGAHAINKAITAALPLVKGRIRVRVVHQTGPRDEKWVQKAYADAGIDAITRPFFNDMADQYRRADLIICRAGATTVAEITAIGKAALFIPFPLAADDHQTRNAQALVNAGAAEMIPQKDLNGEVLAAKIMNLDRNRARLAQMAANAHTLGRPEAALTIVAELYELIEGTKGYRRGNQINTGLIR